MAGDNAVAIGPLILSIRVRRAELDRRYPAWNQAYLDSAGDFLKQDCRREYFSALISTFQNTQLTYMFILHQLSSCDWWREFSQNGALGEPVALVSDFGQWLKIFTFHSWALLTEELLRSIVRCGVGTFTAPPHVEFQSLYRHVLKVTNLQHLEPLFEVLRNTRNTIHNNGFFVPPNGKDAAITYKGTAFAFQNRTQVQFADEIFVLKWLPEQLADAVFEIVTHPVVGMIPLCTKA